MAAHLTPGPLPTPPCCRDRDRERRDDSRGRARDHDLDPSRDRRRDRDRGGHGASGTPAPPDAAAARPSGGDRKDAPAANGSAPPPEVADAAALRTYARQLAVGKVSEQCLAAVRALRRLEPQEAVGVIAALIDRLMRDSQGADPTVPRGQLQQLLGALADYSRDAGRKLAGS